MPTEAKKRNDMKKENALTLTRAELEVMEILWKSGKALDVHEVVGNYPEPQPAYTTISTVVRLLAMKGFVGHKKGNGKQHLYFPQISKAEYISQSVSDVKAKFFGGSVSSFVSFFLQEEQLSKEELEEIANLALSLSIDNRPSKSSLKEDFLSSPFKGDRRGSSLTINS